MSVIRDLDHAELAAAARDGDTEAFCELARRERGRLLATASALLGDRHHAEDAVQEALVAAFRDLPALRDPASLRSWVARILVRIAVKRRRKLRRERPSGWPVRPPTREAPDHRRLDALAREVDRLPDRYRVPLALHYLTGLPYRDVARIVGIPEKRVKSRLHDARERLRGRLRHVED